MKRETFARAICAAAISTVVALPYAAHAVTTTEESGTSPFTVNSSDDVILNREPDVVENPTGGYGGLPEYFTAANSPPPAYQSGVSSDWDTLTDGSTPTFDYSTVVTPASNTQLTYYLANVNTNPYGVNLTAADVYSAWADSGRVEQTYTIMYSTTSNSSVFQPLVAVDYGPNGGDTYYYTSTAASLNNVARIQIDFGTQQNSYVGYQEFVAHGSVATSGTAITPQQNVPIQNYNFTNPTYTGANYVAMPGWLVSGAAAPGVNDTTGAFNPGGGQAIPGPSGSQFAYIQIQSSTLATGSLSQKLDDMVIGDKYSLSYWIGFRNGDDSGTLQAFIDSQAVGNADTPPASGWQEETYSFTYTGTDAAPFLNFVDTDPGAGDETIDLADVQLTNLSVPEPASLSLLALSGVALLRRRRK